MVIHCATFDFSTIFIRVKLFECIVEILQALDISELIQYFLAIIFLKRDIHTHMVAHGYTQSHMYRPLWPLM